MKKTIAFPTYARLYHTMRVTLVREAHKRDTPLRQSFKKVGKKAFIIQGRYACAKQMKRAARQTRKLKTYQSRLTRDIQRKATSMDESLAILLERSQRLLKQQRRDKNRLYSIHEPDVRCIAKGKIHKRYEFGSKASFITTSKDNWVVSAQSLDNPYDGHTLGSALKHVTELTGITPQDAYCDMDYRGHGLKGDTKIHLVGKIPKRATKSLSK
ncbi:MAG: IS5/IS1182 family transposase, partial [Gammaproteobacteria bacterium]